MKNHLLLRTLVVIAIILSSGQTFAFKLIIKSDAKLKQLKVHEHHTTDGFEVGIGENEIKLDRYPNTLYLLKSKSPSNFKLITMIYVSDENSTVELFINKSYNVTVINETPHQVELRKILKTSNYFNSFPYEVQADKPIEPILTLEAKGMIQNFNTRTDSEVLENLLSTAKERGIDNWSTEMIANYLNNPKEEIYIDGKLLKIIGLDSLENNVIIRPDNKKHILLAISGSWCGPCVKAIPKQISVYEEISDKVLFVSSWNDQNLETFITHHQKEKSTITWPSIWDRYGLVANALDTRIYPMYILFDPEGNEINRWEGKFPETIKLP